MVKLNCSTLSKKVEYPFIVFYNRIRQISVHCHHPSASFPLVGVMAGWFALRKTSALYGYSHSYFMASDSTISS